MYLPHEFPLVCTAEACAPGITVLRRCSTAFSRWSTGWSWAERFPIWRDILADFDPSAPLQRYTLKATVKRNALNEKRGEVHTSHLHEQLKVCVCTICSDKILRVTFFISWYSQLSIQKAYLFSELFGETPPLSTGHGIIVAVTQASAELICIAVASADSDR